MIYITTFKIQFDEVANTVRHSKIRDKFPSHIHGIAKHLGVTKKMQIMKGGIVVSGWVNLLQYRISFVPFRAKFNGEAVTTIATAHNSEITTR